MSESQITTFSPRTYTQAEGRKVVTAMFIRLAAIMGGGFEEYASDALAGWADEVLGIGTGRYTNDEDFKTDLGAAFKAATALEG